MLSFASCTPRARNEGAGARALVPPVLLLALLFAQPAHPQPQPTYDDLCDHIVEHAQAAARKYNEGDVTAANAEVESAIEAYEAAVALDPREPQAHVSTAQFYHNVQRFDDALATWQKALPLVQGLEDGRWERHVRAQLHASALGRASTRRDRAYNSGQGNITAAIEHAEEQMALAPHAPQYQFDAATLLLVAAETEAARSKRAVDLFRASQQAAAAAALAFQKAAGGGGVCPRMVELVGAEDSTGGLAEAAVVHTAQQGQGVAVLRAARAQLHGPDAVVVQVGEKPPACALQVYGSAEWPFVGLHANLHLLATWQPPHPQQPRPPIYDFSGAHLYPPPDPSSVRKLKKAASIVGFASASHYHFVMGALPRLVALLPLLHADPDLWLVVPGGGPATAPAFVQELLRLLLPAPWLEGPSARLVWYGGEGPAEAAPGLRLKVRELVWAEWAPGSGEGGGHCLTPPAALRATAHALQAAAVAAHLAAAAAGPAPPRPTVVFARRGAAVRTRQLAEADEAAVEAALRAAAAAAGAEYVDFDASSSSTGAALVLFQRASVVVGLHGGQLANILFCRAPEELPPEVVERQARQAAMGAPAPGAVPAPLLLELAFAAPAAQHYAHAAAALGLLYRAVPVRPDPRGLASQVVQLAEGAVQTVAEATAAHLRADPRCQPPPPPADHPALEGSATAQGSEVPAWEATQEEAVTEGRQESAQADADERKDEL